MFSSFDEFEIFWKNTLSNLDLKSGILAIDIGGSTITYAVIPKDDLLSRNIPGLIIKGRYTTKRGRELLRRNILSIIRRSVFKAKRMGYFIVPSISIGCPGKFVGAEKDIIAENSALNLESYPGEFTNFNLAKYIKKILPAWCKLIVKNDALGQMAGGVYFLSLKKNVNTIINKKIAYIGPGTGLGGGFCLFDKNHKINIKTDGHICDLKVMDSAEKPVKAENVFSGEAFLKKTGKTAKEVNKSPSLLKTFQPQITKMGEYLFEMIARIYTGKIDKINPKNNWPQKDKEFVKGTTIFLIGGSLGTKGGFAKILINTAQKLLIQNGLNDIKLIPIPNTNTVALYGIALFSLEFN